MDPVPLINATKKVVRMHLRNSIFSCFTCKPIQPNIISSVLLMDAALLQQQSINLNFINRQLMVQISRSVAVHAKKNLPPKLVYKPTWMWYMPPQTNLRYTGLFLLFSVQYFWDLMSNWSKIIDNHLTIRFMQVLRCDRDDCDFTTKWANHLRTHQKIHLGNVYR